MNEAKNYFIKPGYKINLAAKTFEINHVGEYWTRDRIESVYNFQFNVYHEAANIAKNKNLKSAVDLGCGPATKARDILRPVLKELYLIDQPNCEETALSIIPSAHFIGVNLESIDLNLNRSFDLIICSDVLEHLNDPTACLEFIHRHIAINGFVILSTPERDILRGKSCMTSPHNAHVREWNEKEFKELVKHHGFKVIEQKLLPPKRLGFIDNLVRILLHRFIKLKKWHSCQMIICQRISVESKDIKS